MDLALYDPEYGYYARAGQRSGRAGDFFTSVDVGPLFGELLAIQLREMAQLLRASHAPQSPSRHELRSNSARYPFDLVEAGAGNGRLSADILRAAHDQDGSFYDSIQLHLVDASAAARSQQRGTLRGSPERQSMERPPRANSRSDDLRRAIDVSDRLRSSSAMLPETFEGVLIANELLDAMPAHHVIMRGDGLREAFVTLDSAASDSALRVIEGSPSTPALQRYLDRLGVRLEPGWRAEINLRAVDWVRDAAQRLTRGFMVLIDYGHEARELYSVTHSTGTLTTFSAHRSAGSEQSNSNPPWLDNPGGQDITAHVDFTTIRAAAETEGMTAIALLDQTYFLLGLVENWNAQAATQPNSTIDSTERSAALKTLIMPGGLGSTQKVLILGKNVGSPALKGCSFKVRLTS